MQEVQAAKVRQRSPARKGKSVFFLVFFLFSFCFLNIQKDSRLRDLGIRECEQGQPTQPRLLKETCPCPLPISVRPLHRHQTRLDGPGATCSHQPLGPQPSLPPPEASPCRSIREERAGCSGPSSTKHPHKSLEVLASQRLKESRWEKRKEDGREK